MHAVDADQQDMFDVAMLIGSSRSGVSGCKSNAKAPVATHESKLTRHR